MNALPQEVTCHFQLVKDGCVLTTPCTFSLLFVLSLSQPNNAKGLFDKLSFVQELIPSPFKLIA